MSDPKNLTYYFANLKKGSLSRVADKVKHPWEIVNAKDSLILTFSKSKIATKIGKNVAIFGPVIIGKGTTIEPFVVIEGPAIIGSNCNVRSFAKVHPRTIIGDEVVIGHAAEVKNSFVSNLAKIESFAFVGDSVIGEGVRIASGVICANRRFDQAEILVKLEEKNFPTGRDKFGAVIGDYCRIGAHCTLAPGAVIGQHVWIYPNLFIKGFIPSDSFVKAKTTVTFGPKKRVILAKFDQEGKI